MSKLSYRDRRVSSMASFPTLLAVLALLPLAVPASPCHDDDALNELKNLVVKMEAKMVEMQHDAEKQRAKISFLENLVNELDTDVTKQTANMGTNEDKANISTVNRQRSPPLSRGRRQADGDCCPSIQAVLDQVSSQVTQLTGSVTALQTSGVPQASSGSGSTYVQWGSSTCSADSATMVYTGVLGGSYYTHPGAAANQLCLTLRPSFPEGMAIPRYHAMLYGGEYETLVDDHQDKDPVCAVCRTSLPTTVMIPGTDSCEAGWTLQYSGYLMAGNYGQPAASEYICVDSREQASFHSNTNDNGNLLYYTVTQCGSLPCDPYANNKIVTCAVCSL